MDFAVFLFATFGSISLIFISKNRKYYQKTVEAYGDQFATKIFRTIKIAGYLMLVGAVCMIVLILWT